MSRSGIGEAHGGLILKFLRTLHNTFQSGYTSFQPHPQYMKVLFFLHSFQLLLFIVVVLFSSSLSNRCGVRSTVVFDLHFPSN